MSAASLAPGMSKPGHDFPAMSHFNSMIRLLEIPWAYRGFLKPIPSCWAFSLFLIWDYI